MFIINKRKNIVFLLLIILTKTFYSQAQEFTIPRLSPLPVGWEKSALKLNGKWMFDPSPEITFWQNPDLKNCKPIEVPGEWSMQGFKVEKGKKAGYYRTFNISSDWKGKRIKLRCNAIYSEAIVYINGKEAGDHIGGFTAFELDITSYIKWGEENEITIAVTNEGLADSLSNASRYAAHPLGGITRDIYIFPLEEANLSMFHITTDFDEEYVNAILKTEIEISNEANSVKNNLTLSFTLKDTDGKEIPLTNKKQPIERINTESKISKTLLFDVQKPEQWTSEHPYLYTFVCELKDGNKVLHTTKRRIGFRKVEVRGNQMFVNNKPIKLRGVCRHEVMPLRGRSLTGNIWEEDVRLFREANVNYIRTSHYPPDEALLEACDELGMFVELEAPFCWAHEADVEEKDYYRLLVNQHIEMVNRDRSHPSIIMWSLGNESNKYEEYFKKAGEIIKIIDPGRPRIFSQWGPEADNGEMEVANHHYPGPDGPDKYRNSKRPVVFDEFCHLNSYNRFELSADPGIRNMWGVLLNRMWNDMYYSQGVLGGALWAGIDDTFFLPDGGAVGYGTWGPIDGWRRPKPEYWNVKKAFSPVRIHQKGNMNQQGAVYFDVENRHNFTNLSECKFIWKSGTNKGAVSVDLEARKNGTFKISLPESAGRNEELYLSVASPLGYIIDEYNFQILPDFIERREERKSELIVKESADEININIGKTRIRFDKLNGLLNIYDNKNKILMNSSPTLMVLPLNSEGRGIQMLGNDLNFEPYTPVCADWICESVEWNRTEDSFQIKVKGRYKEAEGNLVYEINDNSTLSVSYDFTVLEDVNPRQTGLVFNLDETFTNLSWKRKGYWNVYPENHLGSLTGTVEAYNEKIPVSGSAGPDKQPECEWSFDQNKAGINLFRSTKENIYNGSLSNKAGNKISVISNGQQHLRTWIDTDNNHIKMLVADYNNAGREGYLSSHSQKDYKALKKGDKISGTIVLKTDNQ